MEEGNEMNGKGFRRRRVTGMTSIVKLEALSGVKDDGPLCYLLQVDDCYILLDCGWDDNFDLLYIEAVKRRVPHINAVLVSFPDAAHMGALPYLVAKCGLTAPVYATGPVYKMGLMFAYDWLQAHNAVEDFSLFSLDDVDYAFERVQQVKYNQTVLLKGDSGLQITPLPAGHMIGGAIWRISKMGDDDIVYAVDYNHKKERHLNGCSFDAVQRPHLLITDAFNAQYKQPGRKQRDERLVTKMLRTLREGGDCMVVIDVAGRVLEIAHMLEQLWSTPEAGLTPYNLVLLSHVASSVVEFAKSQVEWMSDKVLKSFESGRSNPFQFKHVHLCHSHLELMRIRSPKVVLCPDLSMESGFSRELFLEWCSDSRNTVIITGRSGDRTLGSRLIHIAQATARGDESVNRQLKVEMKRRIRLEGKELEDYRARKQQEEQEEARRKMEANRRSGRVAKAHESDSDSDDEEAIASAVAAVTGVHITPSPLASMNRHLSSSSTSIPLTPSTEGKPTFPSLPAQDPHSVSHDILVKWEQQQRASFFKQNKKSFPMFGYTEEKVKWDDYGEVIRPDDYMIDCLISSNTVKEDSKMKMEEDNGMENREEEEKPTDDKEIPTKCIKYITKLEVLCRVEFIEFEGRSDGESLKKILSQIRPKQLIVVHGNNAATKHMAEYARESGAVQGKIFTPKLGEVVDATVESHIIQVALSDALLSTLVFQTVKEAELVWLDARFVRHMRDESERDQEEEEEEDEEEEEEEEEEKMEMDQPIVKRRMKSKKTGDKFILDSLPAQTIPPHEAVFVNEPKLSDVKQVLQQEGFQAEFSAGVLYINGIASIKRNDAGRFHVEGCASEDYFRIRDIIYNQFAIV